MTPSRDLSELAREWARKTWGNVWDDATIEEDVPSLTALLLEVSSAAAGRALADQRHSDEKHILSQTPVEFLRSRNRKRKCDSDGFIGCERCQTMLVCGDLEEARAQIAALGEEVKALRSGPASIARLSTAIKEATAEVRARAEAAEARAGRYEGLLREAAGILRVSCVTSVENIERDRALAARIDAALAKGGEGGVNP